MTACFELGGNLRLHVLYAQQYDFSQYSIHISLSLGLPKEKVLWLPLPDQQPSGIVGFQDPFEQAQGLTQKEPTDFWKA